jgi:hypothetical protein
LHSEMSAVYLTDPSIEYEIRSGFLIYPQTNRLRR